MSTTTPVTTSPPEGRPGFLRRTSWWVLLLATTVGLVAASAAAAMVGRHLSQSGWSTTVVVASVMLGLGLALLALGVVGLWRRTRRWWRLLFIPGALLGLVVAASVAIAVIAAVVPPTPLGPGSPAQLGLDASTVRLQTPDGVTLAAWYVPSRNGAAVVLLHGAGETRTATLPQAQVLAEHGYGVLLLDARGHGASAGRGMEFGWYGDLDVQGALDFLTQQPDVDAGRIGVLGLSMGGEEAVGAAAADPRIRAVVAEGATSRTAADKAAWLPGGVAGSLQRAIDRMTYGFTDLLTPASPPRPLVDAVTQASGTRFLLVTAGAVPDETLAAGALQQAAPARVEVWDVSDAAHTRGLQTAPQQWERTVVGFLDTTLLGIR